MADSDINIANVTNKFSEIVHEWKADNSFKAGTSRVKLMAEDDSSDNTASTEWVTNFFNTKLPTTPTINVPLLTPMWFDHTVESSAWVKSEYERTEDNVWGWLYRSTYSSIYSHLVLDINTATKTSEVITKDGVTYTVSDLYIAEDGHKIIQYSSDGTGDGFIDDEIFNNIGVSWYYVLDTVNMRFKLPRTRYGFQGIKTSGIVGKYDAAGLPSLPSITGTYNNGVEENRFINCQSGSANQPTRTIFGHQDSISIEVGSSSIYGESSTVQPPATEMYLYFSTGEESEVGSGGGVGGGVIDGTPFYKADGTTQEKTLNVSITTTKTAVYTVKNDCLLYIKCNRNKTTKNIMFFIGDNPIACADDGGAGSDTSTVSFRIPVKRGTIISAQEESTTSTADFYEYTLNSLAPQIAIPDYSATSTTVESGWTATENGWINVYVYGGYGVGSSAVYINGEKLVEITGSYATASRDVVFAPISRGDVVTISNTVGGSATVVFYPCKTVQQSNPPVYITERKHGNYATVFNEDTTYKEGDYVKVSTSEGTTYYRITIAGKGSSAVKTSVAVGDVPTWNYTLYSDGWCEQGGRDIPNSDGKKTITLKMQFIDTSYDTYGMVYDDMGDYAVWGFSVKPSTTSSIETIEGYEGGTSLVGTAKFSWSAKGYVY